MNKDLFDRIKAFLERYLTVVGERRAYVVSALRDCANALPQIEWEGRTDVFTGHLMTTLEGYGDCGDEPAVVWVLREVASKQGTDVQAYAEKLIAEIMAGHTPGTDEICGCKRIRPLGEGGNGTVWLAWQTGTEREVAIKLLRPDKADNAERVRRFREEPQAQRHSAPICAAS